MSHEDFIARVNDEVAKVPLDEIKPLRAQMVFDGKHSPKLLDVAYAKGLTDDPKYFNPDDDKETGAICVEDGAYLYALMRVILPERVVEVGTWFGTSAVVMASAFDRTNVYTCDRHNVYVGKNLFADQIWYYNEISTHFFRRAVRSGVQANFAFIDANLKRDDPPLLRKVLRHGSPIALHDYYGDAKGVRNYQALRPYFKELKICQLTQRLAVMAPRR